MYSAAFDKGYTPASVVSGCAHRARRGRHGAGVAAGRKMRTSSAGPMRLREALAHSRNLVSMRLMRAIGGQYTRDYVQPLRLRQVAAAARPDAGAGHGRIDAAAGGHRLRHIRQRRLSRDPLLHRPRRGRRRQGGVSRRPRPWLARMRTASDPTAAGVAAEPTPDGSRAASRGTHDGKTVDSAEESGAANHPAAGRLSHGRHDEGCHQARHRACARGL